MSATVPPCPSNTSSSSPSTPAGAPFSPADPRTRRPRALRRGCLAAILRMRHNMFGGLVGRDCSPRPTNTTTPLNMVSVSQAGFPDALSRPPSPHRQRPLRSYTNRPWNTREMRSLQQKPPSETLIVASASQVSATGLATMAHLARGYSQCQRGSMPKSLAPPWNRRWLRQYLGPSRLIDSRMATYENRREAE